MESIDMETMETTEERQEVEKDVNQADKGYKALVRFNDRVGQIFGPDLRGYDN